MATASRTSVSLRSSEQTMLSLRFCSVVCLMMSLGCGGDNGVKTADVAGTITKDGLPLGGVEVFFSTGKFEGYGKTDPAGKYRLINGAAVGTNKIYMKKFEGGPGGSGIDSSIPGMDEKQAVAMMAAQAAQRGGTTESASVIPPEYSHPESTKLTFPVPDGGTESADFKL